MQGIKAQNVFIQPHTANLKHKIEKFRGTHVIKDLSRVKVFIIQSQQHQFTAVTALTASILPLKAFSVLIVRKRKHQTAALKLSR